MMKKQKIFQLIKKNRIIILLLLLSAFLRLFQIASRMEFLGDQGRDVLIVGRFLSKGDLMFIGPQTSIGNMYLGPWYYYLIAPALLLAWFNPVGPAILVALLGVATVWLTWRVGREWFGREAGLLAALLMALSPVVIYYSTFSWNPNVMPLFSLLSVWLTWRIWKKREFNKLFWLAVSLTMVLNSHYLGLLLFPPVAFFLFLTLYSTGKEKKERKAFIKSALIALLIFFVLMFPLILFDLKHGLVNFNAFKEFFTIRQTTVNIKFYKGFLKIPVIVNQLMANLIARKDYLPLAYLSLAFLGLSIWQLRKNKAVWFLLAFIIVGILGLGNYKQHVYAHYFGFLWPLVTLLLAAGAGKLRWVFLFSGVLVAWFMLTNWPGWLLANFQLRRAARVADFIEEKSGGDKFALALIAEQNYDAPYRYFFERKNSLLVNLHKEMTDQLFVICEPWGKVECEPVGHPLWAIAAFGWAQVDWEEELEGVRIFRLIHVER